MKVNRVLGTGALTALTLAGIVMSTSGIASAQTQNSITLYYNFDQKTWDPALYTQELYLESTGIFEPLVIRNSSNKIVPGSAQSWSTSKDGLTWTFQLKKQKFSNGDPVTAQDWVDEIQRAVNPNTAAAAQASAVPDSDLPIANMQAIRQGLASMSTLGVSAPNASTLQFKLSRPDANFIQDLNLMNNAWIVPTDPKVVGNLKPADWDTASNIVGNGPYKVSALSIGNSATLVPNTYYNGSVNIKQINLVNTSADGLVGFGSGQLDYVPLQPTDIPAALASSQYKSQLHWLPSPVSYTLEVANSQTPLLRNSELVRKAFEMAIDKNVIAKNVLKGAGVPADNYYLANWMAPWIKKYAIGYNPTEAQKLLAKAGYPGGKGFPTVVVFSNAATGQTDPTAQAIQQMWEQNLGVKVKLVVTTYAQLIQNFEQQLPQGEVGFYVWAFGGTTPQLMLPQSVQEWLAQNQSAVRGFASPAGYAKFEQVSKESTLAQVTKVKEQNFTLWATLTPQVQKDITIGMEAYKKNSVKLMQEFYALRTQEALDIPIYTFENPYLLRSNIQGWNPDPYISSHTPYWLGSLKLK